MPGRQGMRALASSPEKHGDAAGITDDRSWASAGPFTARKRKVSLACVPSSSPSRAWAARMLAHADAALPVGARSAALP